MGHPHALRPYIPFGLPGTRPRTQPQMPKLPGAPAQSSRNILQAGSPHLLPCSPRSRSAACSALTSYCVAAGQHTCKRNGPRSCRASEEPARADPPGRLRVPALQSGSFAAAAVSGGSRPEQAAAVRSAPAGGADNKSSTCFLLPRRPVYSMPPHTALGSSPWETSTPGTRATWPERFQCTASFLKPRQS